MSSSSLSRLYSLGVLSAALSLFGLGCATGSDQVRHGIGAGYWEANIPSLPSRQSPIEAMAFGRGGSSEPATDMGVDAALAALDSRSLQPAAAASNAKLVAARKPAPVQTKSDQVAAQPEQATVASNVTVEQPVLLAANTQESRYASREAQSQDQQKFAGGDAIVITSGAIVLVLLIVLLVLLLR